MEKWVYLITLLFSCLGVVIAFWAIKVRKRAVAQQAKIHWVFDEANRALRLIRSENPDEILVGLQILSVYDIPSIRIKALPRLMELTQHDNKQVAQLAERNINVAQSSEIPEPRIAMKAM